MCEDEINIGVTEIVNTILVEAQPNDQVIDINVTDNTEDVTINATPNLIEVNINTGVGNKSVVVVDDFASLPIVGETETLYIALDTKLMYIWDEVNEEFILVTDYIPYIGAIKNADLGEFGLKAGWLGFDLTPTNTPTTVGTMSWNDSDGTANLKLKGGNVTLQIGQEEVVRVVNKTGGTLNEADFRAVRIRSVSEGGAQGQRLAVKLAQADNDANSATTIGLVTESIAENQEGFITTFGNVNNINTTGAKSFGGTETWVDGDMLYLSPTNAGYLTNVKPSAPNHMVVIGYVVYAHANNGKIFVKVDNGYELDELHNVQISSATNGQALVYNSSTGVWQNQTIASPLTASLPISINSDVISITQANATTNGFLTSADWNYFSAKQQALSGTGFIKATGSTISYDNTTYTPTSRTLTINGTTYDLSSDRSWSIAPGSGMRNVTSFVATANQTTFTIVGGYNVGLVDVFVNGARLNSGDFTATNGTTIVLGAGLVANDIVDVINYVASLTSGVNGTGTQNYITKWSGTSNIANSLLFDNGTNIGLGTTTPAYKLDVVGDINITGSFKVNGVNFTGGTTLNGTGFVKAFGTTISYDNSTYVPTNGTGATGTWGISISGNSATATTATNANAVGNVDISRIVYGSNSNKTQTFSNANDALASGFYNQSSASNMPSLSWYHLIVSRHDNTANNFQMQLAGDFWDNNYWLRKVTGSSGSTTSWARIVQSVSDPYAANMNQYVRTSDNVLFRSLHIGIDSASYGYRRFSRTKTNVGAWEWHSMVQFQVKAGYEVNIEVEMKTVHKRIDGEWPQMQFTNKYIGFAANSGWYSSRWNYNYASNGNDLGNSAAFMDPGLLTLAVSPYNVNQQIMVVADVFCSNWDGVNILYP